MNDSVFYVFLCTWNILLSSDNDDVTFREFKIPEPQVLFLR
jgi:hypothetical protein